MLKVVLKEWDRYLNPLQLKSTLTLWKSLIIDTNNTTMKTINSDKLRQLGYIKMKKACHLHSLKAKEYSKLGNFDMSKKHTDLMAQCTEAICSLTQEELEQSFKL